MCHPTGHGTVATNGRLFLKGQTAAATDRMEIYNAKDNVESPLTNATGYCDGVPGTCSLVSAVPPKLFYYRDPIEPPPIAVCDGVTMATPFDGTGRLTGGVYGYTDVTLSSATIFSGSTSNPT